MTIAQGVSKQVRMKREAAWGVPNGPLGAKDVRRITSDLSLKKDMYESKEIRTDAQDVDARHGMRKVEGSIKSEINPGSQSEFVAAILRRDFTAGVTSGAQSVTVEAAAGDVPASLVRAAGSFITDGFRLGSVVRASGLTTPANNDSNLLVLSVSALKLGVVTLNGAAVVAQPGATAGAVIAEVGKRTFVPKNGHKQISFGIEHFYSDIIQSELFTGLKVSEIAISLPATGMADMDVKLMGRAMVTGAAPYFTDSAEAGDSPALAAVNGRVFIAGKRITNATSANFTIKGNASTEAVMGSNESPEIFTGRVQADGSATVLFETVDQRDAFLLESEQAVVIVLTGGETKNADFVVYTFPRVKFNSADKDDGEKGLIQSIAFKALRGVGASEQTTIAVQDSLA